MNSVPHPSAPPLCVDLDGALVRTNLLIESLLRLVKQNVLYIFIALRWLLRGRAEVQSQVDKLTPISAGSLPYNQELIEWLRSEQASGRHVWLCASGNEALAEAIARDLSIFDGIIPCHDSAAHPHARADELVERFGLKSFHYCGARRADLASFQRSCGAVLVGGGRSLRREIASAVPVVREFRRPRGLLRSIVHELRLHQWAKNVLLLVPLLAAHRLFDPTAATEAVLGLISFCLCASSVYLLNDMLDLEADRAHARKSKRPLAAGDLPLLFALLLAPALLAIAGVIAAFLPVEFRLVIAGYYLGTLAYSFAFKRLILIDATALAGLYTVRIIAGAAAISVPLSFWLLLFSVFLFLSLAFAKRYAELDALRRKGKLQALGRGYHVEDLPMLEAFGIASGYLSVLVMALYINSPGISSLYRRPEAIWPLCVLLLYWISRIWMKAHRGRMHDDPVLFALRDRVSFGVGLMAAITIFIAV